MTPNDLQRVPKAPEGFHNRLVQTLDGLPERKEGISMKRKNVTRLLVAAAVAAVMAVTAIAGGRMLMISSHSYHSDDFRKLPAASWAEEKIGAEPKLLGEFSNGYAFDHGSIRENEFESEGNSRTHAYTSLNLTYAKEDDRVDLSMDGVSQSMPTDAARIEQDGLTLYYTSYTNKIVPTDYDETAEDKAAVESGELVISWGADEVEVMEFQGLSWEQDGVRYLLYGHDMALDRDGLAAMACELMAS